MKKIGFLVAAVLILLLATVAWHRFRVPMKSLIFSIFPILKSEYVDQPIRFNHIHHKEVARLSQTRAETLAAGLTLARSTRR